MATSRSLAKWIERDTTQSVNSFIRWCCFSRAPSPFHLSPPWTFLMTFNGNRDSISRFYTKNFLNRLLHRSPETDSVSWLPTIFDYLSPRIETPPTPPNYYATGINNQIIATELLAEATSCENILKNTHIKLQMLFLTLTSAKIFKGNKYVKRRNQNSTIKRLRKVSKESRADRMQKKKNTFFKWD